LALLAAYTGVRGRWPWSAKAGAAPVGISYGDERGTMQYGSCEVSIPKRHELGKLESPSLLRLEFSKDPEKHVVLLKAEPESADEFHAEVHDFVGKAAERSLLVFVHGYNVTFEDAARRTAQIAYDLKFLGASVCYSWPSQGSLLDYTLDETNVAWTAPHLRDFLTQLATRSGATQIHLIAHSMGNRALTSALRDLAMEERGSGIAKFNQVLLTAPDIDADVFKNDIAPAISKTAERITLYASATDEALILSKKIHGYARAGEAGSDLVLAPGVDTIDATSVDTSLFGHSYYGDSQSVLTDITAVLRDAKPAAERNWLRAEYVGLQKYWVFQR
jgi:esterase/lipase superfamily enzyme